MKLQRIAVCIVAMIATGCSAHGASGTYIARGQGFVEMLQITQAQDGQLLGSLSSTTLKPNGSITQDTTNISGVADGHALTLVTKSPIPLVPSFNLPGTIDGEVITITNPNGQERFTVGSPSDYQSTVQQLQAQGRIQATEAERRKNLEQVNAEIADLNKRLTDYAAMIQNPRNEQLLAAFHGDHAKVMAQAKDDWATEQTYSRGSVDADHTAADISHDIAKLSVVNADWVGIPARGHVHIQQFDRAIEQSICRHVTPVPTEWIPCAEQPAAIHAYQAARAVVLRRSDDIEATITTDNAAMKALWKQAYVYAKTR